MEPEGSLPHSQVHTTRPHPDPDQTSLWRYPTSNLILSSHLRLGIRNGLIRSGFSTTTLYAPLLIHTRATCPTHLILLDLMTQIIFVEEYRL